MREININEDIDRTDIRVGDKIRVSRVVTVEKVRNDSIYGGVGRDRKPITIVTSDVDTIGITETEEVTLLERDKEPIFTIPSNAIVITWRDDEDYPHMARRNEVSQEWVTSQNGPNEMFTTDALIKAIERDEFDGYMEGSFEVLKYKPNLAAGGYVNGGRIGLSRESVDALNRLANQRIISTARVDRTNRSPITGTRLAP
ncbi:hypothetical protein SEA_HORTUS1_18 [Microbacterium phage Hortus1]|nr:hypothetical protein SEA_HORTUS1_18 [Microbacterium phage Hortus1]AWY05592.1 hypothetical protein SEA_OLINDD_18 [Microbacterium phage OlinDD]